jgi:hypothetical protein
MSRLKGLVVALAVAAAATSIEAQGPGGRGPGGPPPTARAAAPFDLTGNWVSLITEDWRWRMWTPPKGDYSSVPINPEGRRVADAWDLNADNSSGNQCRAFGAAAIMRQPTRLRITWQDDATLKIETDAGTQTRLLRFGAVPSPSGERQWQGHSVAQWNKQSQSQGLGAFGPGRGGFAGGDLRVVTSYLKSGYLRKNGVPYSEQAEVTEYFNRHSGPGSLEWFTVTTIVVDPTYLTGPFITSSSFRKEPDGTKFSPSPCQTAPPTIDKPRVGDPFPI